MMYADERDDGRRYTVITSRWYIVRLPICLHSYLVATFIQQSI